ncbi:LOW QUALITY PROTEIN: uncharacterized protein PB18E9.04c-like [Penaeus monodon]|uniref:LOW QUALITY PROTEIN: uncharacterized protein PB18E9.04c-like n=1 Tax=Penaeus monodon TaxID=6687 RepID=UPI0018A79812|nr:LOW QUALITY PROTEIN: uncharacterized protein PB18E9.04c-like [Penaeus monodon]
MAGAISTSSPNSAEVSGSPSPAPSSIGNNAPKYGTLVPNRVFVGGISASTTEQDLLELFSQYGSVKATKIISDRAGVSKGYGFVTFETEDEARRLTQEADNIMLKDRKLNIAPAIKKQVSDVGYMKTYSPRLVESSNSVVGTGGPVFFGNAATYTTYGSTVPVLAPTEYPTFPQTPAAPTTPSAYPTIMYPQPVYYPQQYQYQPTQTVQPQWGAAPQWRWITPGSYPQPECNSPCVAEPSSPPHGDFTTASAVGSLPFASTPVSLACPSTPTTTTTTVGNSTSMSAVTKTVHDSLLQIKPLASTAISTATTSGKNPQGTARPKPMAQDLVTMASDVDKNNNATEDSKVGGGSGDGTSPSTLQTSHQGSFALDQLSDSHCHSSNSSINSSHSSNSSAVSSIMSTASKSSFSSNSTHTRPPKESGSSSHKKRVEEIGLEKTPAERNMTKATPRPSNPPGGATSPSSPCGAGSCVDPTSQHSSTQKASKPMVWNGWIPMTAKIGWGSHLGPSSLCPHHSGAMTPVPASPVPLQASRMLMSPSWTSLGWPLTPPPTCPLTPKANSSSSINSNSTSHNSSNTSNTTTTNKHTWWPQTACSPHSASPASARAPLPLSSQVLEASRRGILLGSPGQSPYSPQQGYSIVVVGNPNQQQCQHNDIYQQHTQHEQQEQQPHEQPYPGDGWLSQPLPGSVPWEWGKSSDIWVHEPKSSCDDAVLPVWGDSRALLPVALTGDDAVAYDPSAINTLQCPESDPNNNIIPGNVWAIPPSICCAPQPSQPWAQCALQSAGSNLQVHGRNDRPMHQQQQQPSSWPQHWQSQLLEQNEYTHWYGSAPPGSGEPGNFVWDASCGPQAGRWPQVNPV